MAKTNKSMSGEELLGKAMRQAYDASKPSVEDDEVEYSKSELINEHKRLIRIMESGDKEAIQEEIKKQKEELNELTSDEEKEND